MVGAHKAVANEARMEQAKLDAASKALGEAASNKVNATLDGEQVKRTSEMLTSMTGDADASLQELALHNLLNADNSFAYDMDQYNARNQTRIYAYNSSVSSLKSDLVAKQYSTDRWSYVAAEHAADRAFYEFAPGDPTFDLERLLGDVIGWRGLPTSPGPWADAYFFPDSPTDHVAKYLDIASKANFATNQAGSILTGLPTEISIGYMATPQTNLNYIGQVFGGAPNVNIAPAGNLMNATRLANFSTLRAFGSTAGHITNWMGPIISGVQAQHNLNSLKYKTGSDYFREYGKVTFDTGVAALTAAFPPAASVTVPYAIFDSVVQSGPRYEVRYGSERYELKDGWTGVVHRAVDMDVDMRRVDPRWTMFRTF